MRRSSLGAAPSAGAFGADVAGGDPAVGAAAAGGAVDGSPTRSSVAPHSTQKRACAGTSAPHTAQLRASGAPHPMQKRAPAGFAVAHCEQLISGFTTPMFAHASAARLLPGGPTAVGLAPRGGNQACASDAQKALRAWNCRL